MSQQHRVEESVSGNGSIPGRAKGCAQESTGAAGKAEAGSPRVAARGSDHEVRAVWYVGGLAESFSEEAEGFAKFRRAPDAYGVYRVARLSYHLRDFHTRAEAEEFRTTGAAYANRCG